VKANVAELEKRVREKLVRKSQLAGLTIYNYTELAQYGKHWDEYIVQARGLIVDDSGEIVARPFPKFFNLGEGAAPTLPDEPYQVFEKIDGSLGIWYHWQGVWRVATRGSLSNEFTEYARQYQWALEPFPTYLTVLTEISMPTDIDLLPRAARHEPGLYLLGAVDRETGGDIDPALVSEWWSERFPRQEYKTIDELLAQAETLDGTEGWVVRFQSGLRLKIKTAWYLRLFRAFNDLTEKRIKELVMEAGIGNDKWLMDFPEELRGEAEAIYAVVLGRYWEAVRRIEAEFEKYNHPDRKTFALSIQDHPDKPFLFGLYNKHNIAPMVLRSLE
jgi:RNA ligase